MVSDRLDIDFRYTLIQISNRVNLVIVLLFNRIRNNKSLFFTEVKKTRIINGIYLKQLQY